MNSMKETRQENTAPMVQFSSTERAEKCSVAAPSVTFESISQKSSMAFRAQRSGFQMSGRQNALPLGKDHMLKISCCSWFFPLAVWSLTTLGGLWISPAASGQETSAAKVDGSAELATSQDALAARYQRFENTLQQLAEYLRKTDPARADLIVRAIGKSKETRVPDQMEALVELLKQERLGDAISRQQDLSVQMTALLELLQSEDRRDEIERERARVQDLIKDVNKLIGQQQDTRSATERGGPLGDVEKRQAKIAEDARKLTQKIDQQDAARRAASPSQRKTESSKGNEGQPDGGDAKENDPGKPDSDNSEPMDPMKSPDGKNPSEGKEGQSKETNGKEGSPESKSPPSSKNGKPSEGNGKAPQDPDSEKKPDESTDNPKAGKPSEGKPSEGKPSQGKPSEGKPSTGKPSQGKPSQGKPSEGKPSQGQPSESQPSESGQESQSSPSGDDGGQQQEKTPGRDEVEQSIRAMDKAIEELRKKNASGASDQQDKALTDLIKAREKLEEILRQLREEERELMLAALESRFREMLAREIAIYNSTMGLASVPEKQRTDRHRSRALELSRQQNELVLEASKALTLLREEGSSIAFPETVEQIQSDMSTVSQRLERADVATLTQQIEKDVIEALEELVDALRQEMEKMKDEKQKQQQQQQQQQQQKALVNQLAELKLLRSLQFRVNRRTKLIGRLVDGEQAKDGDLIGQLRELGLRQEQVRKATYDLATGRNE